MHWWSCSGGTCAAAQPDGSPGQSAGWMCRTGRWQCRAQCSRRRRGWWCSSLLQSFGWEHANWCSTLYHMARPHILPSRTRGQQQKLQRSTRLQQPACRHGSRRTCYLRKRIAEAEEGELGTWLMTYEGIKEGYRNYSIATICYWSILSLVKSDADNRQWVRRRKRRTEGKRDGMTSSNKRTTWNISRG